jgi:carboxylesterase type B
MFHDPARTVTITFGYSFTVFEDPFSRINNREAAFVPILQGNVQDEGTVFTIEVTTNTELALLINSTLEGVVTIEEVTTVYPTLSGMALAAQFVKDFTFLWYVCKLHSEIEAFVDIEDNMI